jgi:LPS export ABC transporter protein LptC
MFKKNLVGLYILLALLAAGCKEEVVKEFVVYKGPLATALKVTTIYSDSGRKKVEMSAPVQNEYASGNRTFPAGITIRFFNKKGEAESKLTANKGYYNKMSEIYTGIGNVIVENVAEKKRMKSEELKWSRFEKRVYTDKFVRIETPKETLLGEGLTAAEDFSTYKILKPRGTLPATVN